MSNKVIGALHERIPVLLDALVTRRQRAAVLESARDTDARMRESRAS